MIREERSENIDFERCRELARRDPEAFERWRHEFLEAYINGTSTRCRRRLRGLQWQIDQVRRRASNPISACISLNEMMWDAFAGEHGLAETLQHPQQEQARTTARVIPLASVRQNGE